MAAELGTLSAIYARAVGLQPERGLVTRNEVAFTVKVRNPETVNHIARREVEDDRPAHGNVNFIRGVDTKARRIGIAVLAVPPPLLAGDGDGDGAGIHRRCHGSSGDKADDEKSEQDSDCRAD